jgi:GAF domain-containing protein
MILKHATHLSGAPLANLCLLDESGRNWHLAAHRGEGLRHLSVGTTPRPLDSDLTPAVAMRTAQVVHIEDLSKTELYESGDPGRVAMVEREGMRTILCVPLLNSDSVVGCLTLFRREVKAFSSDEIALVENFAAQAVIAIENVRQFREVQTRLERETATRQILHVISQSRDDELPVFDAILENASQLCHAPLAFLSVANAERTLVHIPAYRGTRSEFGDILANFEEPITRTELVAVRPVQDGKVVRADDITDDDTYRSGDPRRRQMADVEGARSVLSVPLVKEGVALGAIVLYRREVAPFSDDDVALVQSFAAQAVIAIENVRQFREVQTRLERERASAEVLELISQSRDDAGPVFDAILERGARLCGSDYAGLTLMSEDGSELVYTAHHGPALPHSEYGQMRWAVDGKSSFAEAIAEKRPVLIDDLEDTDLYRAGDPQRVAHVDKDGLHSFMAVPLLHRGKAIGAFGIARFTVKPFSEDDRALIEGFAAQAVIAIENVRQFKALETLNAELGERVEAQVGELERMGRLKRFLPEQVADAVVSSGDDAMLSSHRALIAALFCDIRGFTAFCETAEPEETIEVLQTYHEEMGKLISAHGAGVDHRAGDGIMVLFNDPLPCDDPAGDALRLAFAMRETMADLCRRWRKLGHRLGFGVGISLGYATVGMVGSEGRFHYTASGTAVNLAARLCDMAGDGEILLSPRAWIAVEEDTDGEPVGEVAIKGISAPVEVWRALQARA